MIAAKLGFVVLASMGLAFAGFIHLSWWLQYASARMFQPAPADRSEFDYIVVGSGSAGSVVTGRLVEAGYSVLLVEAGGPYNVLQVDWRKYFN